VQISQSFDISAPLMKISLTAYLFGFSISQLFYGPLSDRLGRKNMLIAGLIIFTLSCLWSVAAHTYHYFVIARAIQGVGAGACMTMSRAILRDCFDGKNYIYVASFLSTGFALGLGISPVIGGHLLTYFSWRSEFVFLAVIGLLMTVAFLKYLPETYVKEKTKSSQRTFVIKTLKNYGTIFKNRLFMCYLLGGVMAYGVIIAYTTIAPLLFIQTIHFSAVGYGWLTALVALAYYASTYTNRKLIHRFEPLQVIVGGLILIILAGILMLIPALWFHTLNPYTIIIPLLIATYGQAFIWSNTFSLALKDLSHMAGTASGFFNFLQMILSSSISAILANFAEKSQLPLAMTLLTLGILSSIIFYVVTRLERQPST
jgi:DHA1 family 2-module integral membrane pump EmrD-like MFS transporter